MNAIAPRGWCPSLFAPMRSGDGLLVRVKPPGGVLTAEAARALASAATRYGNGVIELGNRCSIQLRGLTDDAVAPFAAAMVALGLADADPAVEARRTVATPPLADDDPSINRHAGAVAQAMADMLARETRLAALPPKFGCVVDGGGVLPMGEVAGDLFVRLDGENASVRLDGADLGAVCRPAEAAEAARRLLLAFLQLAPSCAKPPRRIRALVGELGAEAVFAAAGLPAGPVSVSRPPALTLGWLPYGASGRGAFAAGLPFGATDAATLTALAGLSEDFADGLLRVTPWRAFVLTGVTAPRKLGEGVAALGLMASADDPRGGISACPGAPACASAADATRATATLLAALRLPGSVHVSGCAKGCAHPLAADFTLVSSPDGYAVVRQGRAGDAPELAGLTVAEAVRFLRPFGKGQPA